MDFASVEQFEWPQAMIQADTRHNEVRLIATAPIAGRLHVLVCTIERRVVWVISLRRANLKEIRNYAATF